jgi:hypothetical protein
MTRERVVHGRAYRDGTVICDRVLVTVIVPDERLGLAPRERQQTTVRFLHDIEPGFRRQLIEVMRRRGARSRRAAEALDLIELVVDGEQRLAARIEPPSIRNLSLEQTDFRLRQQAVRD